MHHTYFTYSSGRGILGFLECAGLLRGKVLDYGSGPGFLTELLADAGLETHAADYSPKSVAHIEKKMTGRNNWKGAKLIENASAPYPDDSFDLVTCIETIEHVPNGELTPLISEMRRVLRPGGVLLITTPNAENLEENLNYCPFCDTEFHRWQHLRSFKIDDIEQLIAANGMSSMLIQATDFEQFPEPSETAVLARPQLSHHQRLGKFRNHACAGQTQATSIPPWPRIRLSPRQWRGTQSVRSGREDKQVGGSLPDSSMMHRRPTVALFCSNVYPLFDPAVKVPTGGMETRAALFGRGLAASGRWQLNFVVSDFGQPFLTHHEGIDFHIYQPAYRRAGRNVFPEVAQAALVPNSIWIGTTWICSGKFR